MALPSQTERTSEMSRPVMTRTGGRPPGGMQPNKIMLGVATVVLAAGAIYGIVHFLPTGPSEAKAAKPVSITTPLTKTTTTTPPKPADNPIVLSQGKPSGPSDGPLTTALNNNQNGKPAPVDVVNPNPGAVAGSGATQPPSVVPNLPSTSNAAQAVRTQMEAGDRAFAANKFVEARVSYSKALISSEISRARRRSAAGQALDYQRRTAVLAQGHPGDPLVESYTVVSGDSLDLIRKRRELAVDRRLLARVNKMTNPNALHVGQKLKLVRGPFNVVVHKNDFRLDLFAGSPDEPENWLFIHSFKVGLGAEDSSTPLGTFVIKSKKENPDWRNPKTGQHFDANDPNNPIGEYWLGWEGLGDAKIYTGFGLHGTIDPGSIGQRKSMGCVRMGADDIALVYEMLVEQVSLVKVTDDSAMPGPGPTPPPAPAPKPGPIDLTK